MQEKRFYFDEKDLNWFNEHYYNLLTKYNRKIVAVKNKQIVASGKNLKEVLKGLKLLKINPKTAVIEYVGVEWKK